MEVRDRVKNEDDTLHGVVADIKEGCSVKIDWDDETSFWYDEREIKQWNITVIKGKDRTALTVREQFAMAAMQGMLNAHFTTVDAIPRAVQAADALIKELEK